MTRSLPPQTPPPPPGPTPRPRPAGPGRLYTVVEVAELWACSDQLVYDRIASGDLAVVDIGRGKAKIRVPESEVLAFIAKHTRRASRRTAA